ncbi:helix-turn-helix domain-containing protein [Planctomycetota bacterium]
MYSCAAGDRHIKNVIPSSLYTSLGGVERIVNQYLEGLLDRYSVEEKAIVARILSLMVTEHKTKKRIKQEEIQLAVPHCNNLDDLLARLVQQRIIKRSLGEYELIHDFLVRKVLDFVEARRYLSQRVRDALAFIEANFQRKDLDVQDIARAAGVTSGHLADLFKRELGTRVRKELGRIRIARAKRHMTQYNDPLSKVAAECGFATINTFSRKFREFEPMSPQQYRRVVQESGRRWYGQTDVVERKKSLKK